MKKHYGKRPDDPSTYCKGINVEVFDDNFEKALKIFTKKVQEAGIIKEIRNRQQYDKPSVVKKQKSAAARARWMKKKEKLNPSMDPRKKTMKSKKK